MSSWRQLLGGDGARLAQSVDLPDFCFDLRHINLVCNEQAVKIHLGNSKIGILTNRFLLEVVPQLLEIFHLGGGQVELFAVAKDKSNQWPLLALHGAGTEIVPPATKPFAQLSGKVQTRKLMATGIPRKLVSS